MNIHMEDTRCCLCQSSLMETSKHLFVDCDYAARVRVELLQWSNISVPARELKTILEMTKMKHWKKFKKVVAALWGAMVCHI